jgi:hypothetical protein
MSEVWTKWQGHVIDGTFPLHRYLGGSDHSGVFRVELAGREPPEVAIKLVPVTTALGEAYLEHWDTAAGLDHPHLIRILQTGRWELDGLPFVYCVMEYSDQNLAQLLEHRAMSEAEAREMLPPMLGALSFLHNRNLVQGQLKPSNVLVVGDQVKLASDTICRVSEVPGGVNTVSIYDPPESGDGRSAAGDIWALGVTLFEAVTRSPSLALDVRRGGVVLPPDFSPSFREVVSSCLSRRPFDRPKLSEIEARIRGTGEWDAVAESGGSVSGVVVAAGGGNEGAEAASDAVAQVGAASESAGEVAASSAVGAPVGEVAEDAGAPVGEVAKSAAEVAASDGVAVAEAAEAGVPGRESAREVAASAGEPAVGEAALDSLEGVRSTSETASIADEYVQEPTATKFETSVASAAAQEVTAVPELAALEDIQAPKAPAGSSSSTLEASAEIEEFFAPLDETDEIVGVVRPIGVMVGIVPGPSAKGASGGASSAPNATPAPPGKTAQSATVSGPASAAARAPVSPATSATGTHRAPTGASASTSASGTYRAPAGSAGGADRAGASHATSASGTYRSPVSPSTAASGTYRSPVSPSTSASGTYRSPVSPSTSASGTYRAPANPSTSASGTYRSPVAPGPATRVPGPAGHPTPAPGGAPNAGAHSAAPGQPARPVAPAAPAPARPVSTSTSGTYRSPVGPAGPGTSTSGTYRAPVAPVGLSGGAGRAAAGPSTSASGTYRAPVAPVGLSGGAGRTAAGASASASGTYRAPIAPVGLSGGAGRATAGPSTSVSGTYRAPVNPSTSASGIYRSPVAPGPATRVPGPAGRPTPIPGGAPGQPTRPASTSNSGIFRAPVAPAAAPATAASGSPASLFKTAPSATARAASVATPELAKAAAKSSSPTQRQWTSSEQITVRLPTSEPAVLQRIIGQPVTVVPATVNPLEAEEMGAQGAPGESQADETVFDQNAGRASTSQRYLILLILVAAVIVPLCWAGLGAFRPEHDKPPAAPVPQAAPHHSAAAPAPVVRASQPDPAVESDAPAGTMQPGDAAVPANSAASVTHSGTPGNTDAPRMSGSAVGRPGIPGRTNPAAPGGARAPGGVGAAAAAGASASAARAADYSRGAGSSDTTNMTASSGGSASPAGDHEEFPEVPLQIRKSIRGHVKVSVRVIIDQGGSVFAALVDTPGPSHYFERVAIEAAKKWTFPPADSSTRLKLVKFDFTRDGTTGQVEELQ